MDYDAEEDSQSGGWTSMSGWENRVVPMTQDRDVGRSYRS